MFTKCSNIKVRTGQAKDMVAHAKGVLTVWRSVLIVWGTHNDSKVNYCLYLIILMPN